MSLSEPLIIIVEDDSVIAELLEFNLQNNGYRTRSFRDGPAMLAELSSLMPVSLFILDIMLPGPDGFEICRLLKNDAASAPVPVLMLTARSTESDKVRGLTIGADDYITKPFGVREFLARVAALLRRYGNAPRPAVSPDAESGASLPQQDEKGFTSETIQFGPIRIDDQRHRVFLKGNEINMTNREYELLKFLIVNRGIAFTRDELLNAVWGFEYSGETRTVDVHVRQLRRKIEEDDANPMFIQTVRGRGYRFTDRNEPPL